MDLSDIGRSWIERGAHMQSAEDKRRLMKEFDMGPLNPLVAVLKCAAGIVALIAIAAGPWLLLAPGGGSTATEPPPAKMAASFPNSMAESKRIFDERRQRHETRAPDTT